MSDSYKIYASKDYVDEKVGSMAGLPEGASEYQQLVTDNEGNVKWEDRTHYSQTDLIVMLPEATIIGKSAVLNNYTSFTENLSNQHEYIVVYNGKEYKCSTWFCDILSTYVLGNGSLAQLGEDTGEPFFFNAVYNNSMTFVYFNSDTEHTISINDGQIETVKPIDEKYIPNNVPVIQTAIIGQTIAVKTVDENGKPTEWEAVDVGSGSNGLTEERVNELIDAKLEAIPNAEEASF